MKSYPYIIYMRSGKKKKLGPTNSLDKSLSKLLFLAAAFSGVAVSFPKFYSVSSHEPRPFLLMLISSGTMVVISYAVIRISKSKTILEAKKTDNRWPTKAIKIPLTMGFFQLLSMITLTMSLGIIEGALAYPIRSLSSLMTVYVFAFILFRESFYTSEKLGIAFSMVAIGFISYTL